MWSSGSCADSPERDGPGLSRKSILHLRLGNHGHEWGNGAAEGGPEGPLADFCRRTTPLWEPTPGGAFLDLTGTERLYGSGIDGAERIVQLASAVGGVQAAGEAPTRLAARLASWMVARIGGGALAILPDQVAAFLQPVPVHFLSGRKTVADRLRKLGVRNLGDLQIIPRDLLRSIFGPTSCWMIDEAWGRETGAPEVVGTLTGADSSGPELVVGVRMSRPVSSEAVISSLLRGLAVRALTLCPTGAASRGHWRLTVFWPEGRSSQASAKGPVQSGWSNWLGLVDHLWTMLPIRRKGLLVMELAAGAAMGGQLADLSQGCLFSTDESDRRLAEAVQRSRARFEPGVGTASEELSRALGAVWFGPGEAVASRK